MQKTKIRYRTLSFFLFFSALFFVSNSVSAASCVYHGISYDDYECAGDSSKSNCSSSEVSGTPDSFITCNQSSDGGMGGTCCVSKSLVPCADGGTKCDSGKTCQGGQCVGGGGGSVTFVACNASQGYVCMDHCTSENAGPSPCDLGGGASGICCKNTTPGGGGTGGGGGTPVPGGGGGGGTGTGGSRGWNTGELADTFPGLSIQPIEVIIKNLVQWFLYIIGFLAIIAFIVSAIQYFMAGADEDMAKKAKNSMLFAIIGVIVALSGLVIIYAIDAILHAGGTI